MDLRILYVMGTMKKIENKRTFKIKILFLQGTFRPESNCSDILTKPCEANTAISGKKGIKNREAKVNKEIKRICERSRKINNILILFHSGLVFQ